MALTKTETATIHNLIARLKMPNCGCHVDFEAKGIVDEMNKNGVEAVTRLYLESWVIPALELLVAEKRDPKLAESLSRP